MPVAALPERPESVAFAGYLAWLVLATFAIGARVAGGSRDGPARWQDVTIDELTRRRARAVRRPRRAPERRRKAAGGAGPNRI